MFYSFIEKKWQQGKVRIGLQALGQGDNVTLKANGLAGMAVGFLSRSEKQRLADLAKLYARASLKTDQQ